MIAVRGSKQDPSPEQANAARRREWRLQAFHPAYRRFIAELTACSSELEDLADTFPALLFALVSDYATAGERERCFDLVGRGAPLREAADALRLPWWLRRLPASAFTVPLPVFPLDPEFCFRIANLLPRDTANTAVWLQRVSHAFETAGPDYALWMARQPDLAGPPDDLFMFMAAWAWFSGKPGLPGHRLLRRPWTADMSFKRAREELAAWRQRLRLIECLGPGIERAWLADGPAAGFQFVALRTVDDFIAESEALENCLDQYADQLHTGLTAVFSIRKGARRVACVEIGLHDEEVTMPTIVQLRAARNRRAPPEVWQATFSWLGSQRLEPLSPLRCAPKPLKRIEARRELWRPYLEVLASTRYEPAFKRAVFQSTLRPSRDRPGLRPRPARPPRRAAPSPTRAPRSRPIPCPHRLRRHVSAPEPRSRVDPQPERCHGRCMTTPAGWVVQAIIPTDPEERTADARWRPAVMLTNAPSFAYFNVAIAASEKAIDAATQYLAKSAEAKAGEMSVVRKLSAGEVAALGLKAGEVRPA